MTPFAAIAPLMPSATASLLAFAPIMALSAFCFGPAVIALQLATPIDLRARTSALFLLVVNLAGIGLGGTVVAAISDFSLGADGARIGEALALAGGASALIGVPLLFLARHKMPTYEERHRRSLERGTIPEGCADRSPRTDRRRYRSGGQRSQTAWPAGEQSGTALW